MRGQKVTTLSYVYVAGWGPLRVFPEQFTRSNWTDYESFCDIFLEIHGIFF